MFEQVLQHVRARVLSGGRPIYIAEMLRILSAPDTEEPDPTIRDEGSESEDSAQSDEKSSLVRKIGCLPCSRIYWLNARNTPARGLNGPSGPLRYGKPLAREEAGQIIQAALLQDEQEPWSRMLRAANMEKHLDM